MDGIKGQVIIEVSSPVPCLIDETKFRTTLEQAIKLRNDLTEAINESQKEAIEKLKWDRSNTEQKQAR